MISESYHGFNFIQVGNWRQSVGKGRGCRVHPPVLARLSVHYVGDLIYWQMIHDCSGYHAYIFKLCFCLVRKDLSEWLGPLEAAARALGDWAALDARSGAKRSQSSGR
jgi:hypothetical protein